MLKNTFMIDYLICHTFISEATQFISKLIKKYNHMHVIFNNITTKWLVVYREGSHLSDENFQVTSNVTGLRLSLQAVLMMHNWLAGVQSQIHGF